MNVLGNGLQFAAFIVLTVAVLAGLIMLAATVTFLLYQSRPRPFGFLDAAQIMIGKYRKG